MTGADGSIGAPMDGRPARVESDAPVLRTVLVALQLAAVLLLFRAFELETRTVFHVLMLAFAGFMASAIAPPAWRLPLFAALSLGSVVVAIGFDAASVVITLGLLLVVIAHLPLPWGWRVMGILALGGMLAWVRSRPDGGGLPAVVLPVLASMFMFRMALYLHAVRHRQAPLGVAEAVSYFFMLPNAVFPLFPVVDYQAFVGSRSGADPFRTWDRGIRWIIRGLLHLLAYRLVVYNLEPSETWVYDLGDLLRYVGSAFLRYLEVSGRFHLIVGTLHLFGFRLPETHHLYLLASSFNDLWRRINIYWKDFLLKLVYYPGFFLARRHGLRFAMIVSTLAVFAATWALHSYQAFWLVGAPLLSWRDAAFWLAFGLLAVLTVAWQSRRQGPRPRPGRGWSAGRAIATVGTMTLVLVLWSFWTADSFATWVLMWREAGNSSPGDCVLLVAMVALGLAVAGFGWGLPSLAPLPTSAMPLRLGVRAAFARTIFLALLCVPVIPRVQGSLPPRLARLTRDLQGRAIAAVNFPAHVRGYYERLDLAADHGFAKPWRTPGDREWWSEALETQERDGFLVHGLRPGARSGIPGRQVSVNAFGFRDRERTEARPAGTYRIALIGPSDVMGFGVGDDQTMTARLQQMLDSLAAPPGRHVEVLAISAPAWSIAQEVYAVQAVAQRFQPDLVLITVHPLELYAMMRTVRAVIWRGIPVPDSTLAALVRRADATLEMDDPTFVARLRLVEREWHDRVAAWAREVAAASGSRIAAVEMRIPYEMGLGTLKPVRQAMESAGIPVLRCTDAFAGYDEARLWIDDDVQDFHPNALGHELVARCLLRELQSMGALPEPWRGGGSPPGGGAP